MTSFVLSPDTIALGTCAADKTEAILLAGELLVAAGHIAPDYVTSLMARENVSDTYLDHGVAIPHGLTADRHLIRRTGIAVLQLPDGVEWGENRRVRLVIAIAAQSDEHLSVLKRLTRLINDPERLSALIHTADPGQVIAALTGDAPVQTIGQASDLDAESFEWILDYPNGLHARPASEWVKTARRHAGDIRVSRGNERADGKSLLSLLQLGLACGDTLRVEAGGAGAAEALARLRDVMQKLTREECSHAVSALAPAMQTSQAWRPGARAVILRGLNASPGFVIAPLLIRPRQSRVIPDQPMSLGDAGRLLDAALAITRAELIALGDTSAARFGAAQAGIFKAQAELLGDTDLIGLCCRLIVEGHGPAYAWQQATHTLADRLSSVGVPLLAARATDLRDVSERVLSHLLPDSASRSRFDLPEGRWILVAEDLTPSDTAELDPSRIAGIVTVHGGPTSHTAILARTLSLPALVAAGDAVLALDNGKDAILDAATGRLILPGDKSDLESARDWMGTLSERQARDADSRQLPAITTDGCRLEIGVNLNRPAQVKEALEFGAEGVGLMRTEFLFLESDHLPGEEEQLATYFSMQDALDGRELIVRLLDIGGDKQVPHLALPREDNPFLGVRGIRLLLRRPDLLEPQLRALYRAALSGRPLSILFPMISTLAEVNDLKTECERIRGELGAPRVDLGIMIEVPAAAAMADQLAAHVDFFSIGTNDLTQYVLAIDRQHPELAAQADSLHPAVLRLIRQTIDGARLHQRRIGVCGGLAGDPLGAALLAGLGVDALSMSAGDIPAVKAMLRNHSMEELQRAALRSLSCADAGEVRRIAEELA
ncbi:phosphoenolpyruvate--protein phosphotransferase [Paludibacterium paludis]|uniref:phosphoenolpyruvate--protein phosphotransferase n=1 Tax=Paludibacterium paludis TaxID=1225769 RepID=A0A918P000_9NEIS|nr:phosphoenolpyruvate--protein phosphotransferase [Paludibacterium paludis]GGY08266.1 phosphoenolpyruvate--protein phosphotransferase [Paludibacterium paludis]